MPHFIIDCSENILTLKTPEEIIRAVYESTESTNLFDKKDAGGIKVRINPYKYYTTVDSKDDFIHVFANLMEGRTTVQKKNLSNQVITKLKSMFPSVQVISMNIRDFEKSTYCNKSMV